MLENIEIVDYKCLKNFQLDGISQINIISGGNNIGKTALLEALFIERIATEFASIKLIKNKENKIIPLVMNSENLSFGIEIGEDFR